MAATSVSSGVSSQLAPTSILTEEEANFLRIVHLLLNITHEAVRLFFDSLHPPTRLQIDLASIKSTLAKLRGIGTYQWNILYPIAGSTVTSLDLDITMLICLLRNMIPVVPAPVTGFDVLPNCVDVSVGADLARIKYYRNQIAHNKDGKLSSQEFNLVWSDLENAVGRLGGSAFLAKIKCARVAILDNSLREILLTLLKHEKNLVELKIGIVENRGLIEDSKETINEHQKLICLHQEEIGYCQHKIVELLQEVNQHQLVINRHQTQLNELVEKTQCPTLSAHLKHEFRTIDKKLLQHEHAIERHSIIMAKIDAEVTTHKTTMSKHSEDICNLKQRQELIISDRVQDTHLLEIEEWEMKNKNFVKTEEVCVILETLMYNNCITITGPPYVGKSANAWHVAMTLRDTQGYMIIPCQNPSDVVMKFKKNTKQVFVIEDACGRYTSLQSDVDDWLKNEPMLNRIFKHGYAKMIASCRLQVFKESQFQRLSCFTKCYCLLSSQKYSNSKKTEIFNMHAEKAKEFTCHMENGLNDFSFPAFLKSLDSTCCNENIVFSLYKAEFDELRRQHNKTKLCALFLCVVYNGRISESTLMDGLGLEERVRIENIFEECGIDRGTPRQSIMDHLDSLVDTYLKKEVHIHHACCSRDEVGYSYSSMYHDDFFDNTQDEDDWADYNRYSNDYEDNDMYEEDNDNYYNMLEYEKDCMDNEDEGYFEGYSYSGESDGDNCEDQYEIFYDEVDERKDDDCYIYESQSYEEDERDDDHYIMFEEDDRDDDYYNMNKEDERGNDCYNIYDDDDRDDDYYNTNEDDDRDDDYSNMYEEDIRDDDYYNMCEEYDRDDDYYNMYEEDDRDDDYYNIYEDDRDDNYNMYEEDDRDDDCYNIHEEDVRDDDYYNMYEEDDRDDDYYNMYEEDDRDDNYNMYEEDDRDDDYYNIYEEDDRDDDYYNIYEEDDRDDDYYNKYEEDDRDDYNDNMYKEDDKDDDYCNMNDCNWVYTFKCIEHTYSVLNEHLLKFLTFYFGQTQQKGIIKYADSKIIRDRTRLKSLTPNTDTFDIVIEEENETEYFTRIVQELSSGNTYDVLNNKQMCIQNYKSKLKNFVRQTSNNSHILDMLT